MLFAFGPQLRRLLAGGQASTPKATVGVLAVAIYGGYFNRGLGILLVAYAVMDGFDLGVAMLLYVDAFVSPSGTGITYPAPTPRIIYR